MKDLTEQVLGNNPHPVSKRIGAFMSDEKISAIPEVIPTPKDQKILKYGWYYVDFALFAFLLSLNSAKEVILDWPHLVFNHLFLLLCCLAGFCGNLWQSIKFWKLKKQLDL
jgi:hypothetical protein